METSFKITDEDSDKIAISLNLLLTDEYLLYSKTRNTHWNINDPYFYESYTLFENQYESLNQVINDIAQKVRSLGHSSMDSMKDCMGIKPMCQENHEFHDSKQIIQNLVNGHESIILVIQDKIAPIYYKYKEPDKADFVTRLMQQHQKMAVKLKVFSASAA